MKKLVLIDGNAIVHRAFHALPPLTNASGAPTNAIHGFFSMLLSIIDSQSPDNFVVCFDRPKPTFRQTLFVGYQQNRPAMSDDLKPQILLLHDILREIGVCIFEVDGFEADDLIGTLSKQAKEKEFETVIVSGDRDLLQLVNGKVKVLMPIIGISKSVLMGESEVEEKYGIKPIQIIDWKALTGDASDGYLGVSGIGPKTAQNLLKQYKNLEEIYENLKKINPKISLKLATDAEQAALAKRLATIDINSPVNFKPNECPTPKLTKVGNVLKEFGFRTLSERAFKFAKPGVQTEDIIEPGKKKKEEQLDLL